MTMALISTTTLTGSAASINLASIPQTYTDLVALVSARVDTANVNAQLRIQFNGQNTGTNYQYRVVWGDGSTVASFNGLTSLLIPGYVVGNNATASIFSNSQIYISNYTSTTQKSIFTDMVSENNDITAAQSLGASSWVSTTGITSIQLSNQGNFMSGTSVSLYGILKGSGGATIS